MSVTDIGADKRIFLRKASGLIRTAGLGGYLHLQSRRGQHRPRRRLDALLRPRLLPARQSDLGVRHRRHRHGDDLLRLHHLDHNAAALRRHLCVRIAHPAAGARVHHEPGRDHGLAVLLRHRRLLDGHPRSGADVCRAQSTHRQRDLPHHLEDHARTVGDVPDRRGDPARVAGRAVLRDALLSHPQQMGVHSRHGEHGVLDRGAGDVDPRAVRRQSKRADWPVARRA